MEKSFILVRVFFSKRKAKLLRQKERLLRRRDEGRRKRQKGQRPLLGRAKGGVRVGVNRSELNGDV